MNCNYLSFSLFCCSFAGFNSFAAQKEEKEKTTDAKVIWHNQLVESAKKGDIESVRALCNTATVKKDAASTISGYANITEFLNSKHSGTCALVSAAECGQLEMVKFLLKNKAHPLEERADGQIAFLIASEALEEHEHEWQADKIKKYEDILDLLMNEAIYQVLADAGVPEGLEMVLVPE